MIPNNNKFCPLPWLHLQVEPNGLVRPCCVTQAGEPSNLGNINDQPLEDLWNSDKLKQLRKDMLEGKSNEICDICYKYDEMGIPSFRTNAGRSLAKRCDGLEDAIANTASDGTCNTVNMEYWDFRFSNMCNFKCRTCGPGYSNAWYSDAEKLGWNNYPTNKKLITWMKSADDRVDHLKKYVHQVKEIYFAGGEPLIMDEHYRVLDMLLEAGRTDVKIRYNSNMSSLKYKGKDVIEDYWKHFKDVQMSGSLDAVGRHAEYIRSGTKWDSLDTNIRRLHDAAERGILTLMFNVTISNMSILYLDEMMNYFQDVGIIKPLNTYDRRPWQFHINLVFTPEHSSIQHMPDSLKQEVIDKYNALEASWRDQHGITWPMFSELYPMLEKEADPRHIKQFTIITKEVDAVRKERIEDYLPEVWKHYMPLVDTVSNAG